jgi:CRP/FNR family transcriptional regulator, cyclic AMP receptor protein
MNGVSMMKKLHSRKNPSTEILASLSIFSECNNRDLLRIAPLATEHDCKAGDVLTLQGEAGHEFFVIVEGFATAFREGLALATLGRGQFFGEIALLDGGQRTASVIADTNMRVLVFSKREFSSLNLVCPAVTRRILSEVGARLRSTYETLGAVLV